MTSVPRPWVVLLWLLAFSLQAAPQFPTLTGRVVDEAHVLSGRQQHDLEQRLAQLEKQSQVQLVVTTLSSLQGNTIEDFGYQLGRHWGIGQQGKNNGLLLIVAPQDRKVRIEVGYGLEGTFPDALAANIIATRILPRFRQGDMPGGIDAGVNAIEQTVAGQYTQGSARDEPDHGLWFFLAMVILMIVLQTFRGRRRRRNGFYIGGGSGLSGGFGNSGSGGFRGGGGSFGGGGASGGW